MYVAPDPDLLEFYGTECPHCIDMEPFIERLQKEGIELTRFEVWHNEKNKKLFEQVDNGKCGGVPFFFNRKTGKFLCGSTTSYDQFKKWATGK